MHTTFDDLEARWTASPPVTSGVVHALVLRTGDGRHSTPPQVEVSPEEGLHGDRWRGGATPDPESQVSLIEKRVLDLLVGGDPERLHVPGDNIVVDLELSEAALPTGSRLQIGSALLEVSEKLHAGCSKFRARLGDEALRWVNSPEGRQRRLRGLYARVIAAGTISVGDRATILPRTA
jgi:MOSC domain-containing protein YiiM